MNKKYNSVLVFISLASMGIPCLLLQTKQPIDNDKYQNNKLNSSSTKVKHERAVQKFRSTSKTSTVNIFKELYNKIGHQNLKITLLNQSKSFSFSARYSNFSQGFGEKAKLETTALRNTSNSINVGINLLPETQVKLNIHGSEKWVNLEFTKAPLLDPKNVVMSSVIYKIVADGSAISPSIVLNRTYLKRTKFGVSSSKFSDQYGVFNVEGARQKIGNFFSTTWGAAVIGIIVVLMVSPLAIGQFIYLSRRPVVQTVEEVTPRLLTIDRLAERLEIANGTDEQFVNDHFVAAPIDDTQPVHTVTKIRVEQNRALLAQALDMENQEQKQEIQNLQAELKQTKQEILKIDAQQQGLDVSHAAVKKEIQKISLAIRYPEINALTKEVTDQDNVLTYFGCLSEKDTVVEQEGHFKEVLQEQRQSLAATTTRINDTATEIQNLKLKIDSFNPQKV